jgi:hypothetical protein
MNEDVVFATSRRDESEAAVVIPPREGAMGSHVF